MLIGANVNGQLLEIGVLAADDNDYVIHAMPARTKYIKMIVLFSASAPSTSRSCAPSASDCDTSFGLGLPFVFLLFFAVYLSVGAATRALTAQVRRRRHSA